MQQLMKGHRARMAFVCYRLSTLDSNTTADSGHTRSKVIDSDRDAGSVDGSVAGALQQSS